MEWEHFSESAYHTRLSNGWYLLVVKNGQWTWNVNAPSGDEDDDDDENALDGLGMDPNERLRHKIAEQRCGTLEQGKTLRDAKEAAEAAARRHGILG